MDNEREPNQNEEAGDANEEGITGRADEVDEFEDAEDDVDVEAEEETE